VTDNDVSKYKMKVKFMEKLKEILIKTHDFTKLEIVLFKFRSRGTALTCKLLQQRSYN